MHVEPLALAGLYLLTPKRFGDQRGYFAETYRKSALEEIAPGVDFVQDNESLSAIKGTLRGLHFQTPPYAQAKLVRVAKGAVLDVAVDLRRTSPTFGQHVATELSAENGAQLFIPAGFAHGFCTLAPDTLVIYKASAYYSPAHDAGVLWSDPALGIDWPVSEAEVTLSDKDRNLPRLADLQAIFSE